MKRSCLVTILVLALSALCYANSWSIGPHYIKFNHAKPGGSSDNFGVSVSFDWDIRETTSFGVEALGSWDNDAEVYGAGINFKQQFFNRDRFDLYVGPYIDWIYATELQSQFPGVGKNEDGFMWGPLLGMNWEINEKSSIFMEYRYGFFDGGTIRRAFDEANLLMVGLTMKM